MIETVNVTAKSSEKDLPNDTQQLKQMVLMLLGQIDDLHGQLYYLKKQMFGKKSEKLDPNQLMLFQDLYDEIQAKIDAEEDHSAPKKRKPKQKSNANHPGRNPFPEDLPRDEHVIEPSADEKVCPTCQSEKQRIGQEVTEKLDYIPASFRVKRIVRPKYGCKQCQDNISIAHLPAMAIDKGIAAEGLLAHIITSKYADHLPLNRLESIISRHGVDLTVSTMCDSVARCSDLLEPLVQRMHQRILESPKIHSDATVVPVKSKKRKGSTYNGYLWVYIGVKNDVVFDFTPTQSREGPNAFFQNYRGYAQVDAHSSFEGLFKNGHIIEVGCHAHARRKFDQAQDNDPVRSVRVLLLWKDLYAIERQAKEDDLSPEALLALRQEKAKPILKALYDLLGQWQSEILPKSPLGKAITYAMNQRDALHRYLADPILSIDNNLSERTLRTVAIGRKNWMFAGSEAGAKRAAVIYSLVASCKLCGHDPYAYFRDVLTKISTYPASQIDDLLPTNWQKPVSD